jgi:hypothetical protein
MNFKFYTDFVVVPARMKAMLRLLWQEGALSREQLLGMLEMRERPQMAASVWLAAEELGLVALTAKKCDLHSSVRNELDKLEHDFDRGFAALLGRRICQAQVRGKQNGFALFWACLYLLPMTELPKKRTDMMAHMSDEKGTLLDEMQARNTAVWDNIFYWGRTTGLAYQLGGAMWENIVTDPTLFLELQLDELIAPTERITTEEFIQRLGRICPVLDGGEVRRQAAERFGRGLPPHAVSDGLNLGLMRLEQSRVLRLESVDDASEFHVLGGRRRVTHFSRP